MKAVLAKTLALFLLVQIASLFIGFQFIQNSISVVENPASTSNSLFFFAVIVAFAAVLLIILKLYKGKLLFRALELAMELTALQLLLALFLNVMLSTGIALVIVLLRIFWPPLQQPLLLLTVAIVGSLLGASLDVLPAVILAVLLAGYDVVAVFYTKHMVELAKNLTKREAAFSIKIQENKEKLELGTGDLVIPAMLIVSAGRTGKVILTVQSFVVTNSALFALIGAVVGITALLLFLERKKGYWPALPPITAGTLLGIGASMLL